MNLVRKARRAHTRAEYQCWTWFLFCSAFSGGGKNRWGAFVLFKIHLIMSVAGSSPELVGFNRRRRRKKKKPSLKYPAQWYTLYTPNTVAQISHNPLEEQLVCLEPLGVDVECHFQGETPRVEEDSTGSKKTQQWLQLDANFSGFTDRTSPPPPPSYWNVPHVTDWAVRYC